MYKFDVVVKDDLYVANKGDVFPDKEANVIEEKVYVLVVDSYKKFICIWIMVHMISLKEINQYLGNLNLLQL